MAMCFTCKKPINRGTEAQKRVECYQRTDTREQRFFGIGAPDGKLGDEAKWRSEVAREGLDARVVIKGVYHSKHWHQAQKREMRGGDVTGGRNLGAASMTAYEISSLPTTRSQMEDMGLTEEDVRGATLRLSQRAERMREMAAESGTATGDWLVKERVRRIDHGGKAYRHSHMATLRHFQLYSHLLYAHDVLLDPSPKPVFDGVEPVETLPAVTPEDMAAVVVRHGELHAQMERDAIQARRDADPGDRPADESDWRDQEAADVGDVAGLADVLEETGG
jgi:hypothetical protein